MRASALAVLVLGAVAAAGPVPSNPREVARLVEKLGAPDFNEREAATRRLDELGPAALDDLRAASRSEDLEVARRAGDLVRKIERRAAGERVLAPTVVELNAKNVPLDTVLAALSKQADCEVVLGGPNVAELAAKKVTVATGKVPFWTAVLKVCDAAGLQIAGAGGFVAPGSGPYNAGFAKTSGGKAVRFTLDADRAVVLESRGANKRPAFVHGAVLTEAFAAPPDGADGPAALVQFWPEPKLAWQSVADLKITRASDASGRPLARDLTPQPVFVPLPGQFGGLAPPVDRRARSGPGSANVRQAVAKFQPNTGPTSAAGELTGSALALVRSSAQPLAVVVLDPKGAVTATGRAGVELTASVRTDEKGKRFVDVNLVYSPAVVEPAAPLAERPGVRFAAAAWNRTLAGVRVTDADGAAFELALPHQRAALDLTGRLAISRMSLELVAAKNGPTEPARVVFWGRAVHPVEVPFTLKDVPLR